MYSNRKCVFPPESLCVRMVENCLLNNNNILCSISSSAKFNIKRGDTREIRDIHLDECVFTILYGGKHCKFTYNNAHTLIRHRVETQQPAVCLLFRFEILFPFYFYFIYEIPFFLFTQLWLFCCSLQRWKTFFLELKKAIPETILKIISMLSKKYDFIIHFFFFLFF